MKMAMVEIIDQLIEPQLRHQAETTGSEFKEKGLKLVALGLPRAVEAFYQSVAQKEMNEAQIAGKVVLGLFLLVSRENDPIKQEEIRLSLKHLVSTLAHDSELHDLPELYDLNQWVNL